MVGFDHSFFGDAIISPLHAIRFGIPSILERAFESKFVSSIRIGLIGTFQPGRISASAFLLSLSIPLRRLPSASHA